MPVGRPAVDPVRDRDTLLDHPTRRHVARLCRAQPRSVTELARALRIAPPGIRTTVEHMEEWGVLYIAGRTKRRAATYGLTQSWQADLAAAVKRHEPELLEGQPLLWVAPGASAHAADGLLKTGTGDVAWLISFGDRGAMLVGLLDETPDARTKQMRKAADPSNGECIAVNVRDLVKGESVDAFVRGMRANP